MKKSMSFIAALALTTAMVSSIATSAASVEAGTPHDVTLKYTSDSSYTVTIPDEIDDVAQAINVKAENVVISPTAKLNISVNSEDGFALKLADDSLAYTLKNGETEIDASKPFVSIASSKTADVDLAIELADNASPKYAGTYTDTLTFTVSVDEEQTQQNEPAGGEEEQTPAEEQE